MHLDRHTLSLSHHFHRVSLLADLPCSTPPFPRLTLISFFHALISTDARMYVRAFYV